MMTGTKHTAGDWAIDPEFEHHEDGENITIVKCVGDSDAPIAEVFNFFHYSCIDEEQFDDVHAEALKTAHLIAAAPELLAALIGLEAEISSRFGRDREKALGWMSEPLQNLIRASRAAIAKADGESE